MGCDYYIDAKRPDAIRWICYHCGREVKIDKQRSLDEHENCTRERSGKFVIPLIMETTLEQR